MTRVSLPRRGPRFSRAELRLPVPRGAGRGEEELENVPRETRNGREQRSTGRRNEWGCGRSGRRRRGAMRLRAGHDRNAGQLSKRYARGRYRLTATIGGARTMGNCDPDERRIGLALAPVRKGLPGSSIRGAEPRIICVDAMDSMGRCRRRTGSHYAYRQGKLCRWRKAGSGGGR